MALTKVKNWFKGLFKTKPTEADQRKFAISDDYIGKCMREERLRVKGGAKAIRRWEADQRVKESLKPSYPPARPTDGYQPAARAFNGPPSRQSNSDSTTANHANDDGFSDLMMASLLLDSMGSTSGVKAPDVRVTVQDRTVDISAPTPAPAPPPTPSYEPTFTSAPSFSDSYSSSYSSSDSYSSSSSFDSGSSSSFD